MTDITWISWNANLNITISTVFHVPDRIWTTLLSTHAIVNNKMMREKKIL